MFLWSFFFRVAILLLLALTSLTYRHQHNEEGIYSTDTTFDSLSLLVLVIPRHNKKSNRNKERLGKEDASHQTIENSWQPNPWDALVWLVSLYPLYNGPRKKGPALESQEEGRDVTKKGPRLSVSLVWYMVGRVTHPDDPDHGPRERRCQVQGLRFISGRHNHKQDEEKGIDVSNRRDTNSHILCIWHCLFVSMDKQRNGILKLFDLI